MTCAIAQYDFSGCRDFWSFESGALFVSELEPLLDATRHATRRCDTLRFIGAPVPLTIGPIDFLGLSVRCVCFGLELQQTPPATQLTTAMASTRNRPVVLGGFYCRLYLCRNLREWCENSVKIESAFLLSCW